MTCAVGLTKLSYIIPLAAASLVAVVGPLIVYCRRKRMQNNNDDHQPINPGNNGVDHAENHFNDPNQERGPKNSQNAPQAPSSRSPGSSSDITVPNNQNVNTRKTNNMGMFA